MLLCFAIGRKFIKMFACNYRGFLIFRAMSDALRRGDEVKITNFGVFEVRTRAARPGRNPRTGAFVPIPPRQVVVFRAAEALQINEDMVSSLKGESNGV